ncbi:helix-turn-helix domain-containing protein [Winogradskya humida]|uniref:Helix-turn-helix protein n=1 Tax=Winogradskya humida TaxID=113566 RepID=A0ABQ4A2J2_9ACTN|nr:helix-turn-helix transcriptional regulator [Actinoplanes humidus]GIE24939.1 hypothetical protein Ahu01nite_080410 [Actinoplanes humidus]
MATTTPSGRDKAQDFVERLENLRVSNNLTYAQLSQLSYKIARAAPYDRVLGFSPAAVSNWVNGDLPSKTGYVRAWVIACGVDEPERWVDEHTALLAARRRKSPTRTSMSEPEVTSGRIDSESPPVVRPPRKHRMLAAVTAGVVAGTLLLVGGDGALSPTRGAGQRPPNGANDLTPLRTAARCAENFSPPPAEQYPTSAWADEPGPSGAAHPDRLIELHFADFRPHGWVAWAEFATSSSDLDRLWLDWTYIRSPEIGATWQWRQCGPQPITAGTRSPAVLLTDGTGRDRWFRACGQVPPADRPSTSRAKSFCTGWHRPF